MFNLARIAGPALAGALIGIVGMAGRFLVSGLSYIAVLLGYSMLKLPKFKKGSDHPPFREAIGEAFQSISKDGPMRAIMILPPLIPRDFLPRL